MKNAQFRRLFGRPPQILSSAPGRVNIIGEHTDYNNGYVLPAAIDLRAYFLAARRSDGQVRLWADDFRESGMFSLGNLKPSKRKKWENYVRGIFWVLVHEGYKLGGVDALIWGDVPMEAGLSSSAALEVSLIQGLDALFDLGLERLQMAKLAQQAENVFVGVKCGLMDQFVAVFGRPERAIFLDCENLNFELIPLKLSESGLSLLVYDTRVRRKLASSEYNKRRQEAAAAFDVLKTLGIQSYKDADLAAIETAKSEMTEVQYRRARHVVSENERVKKAVRALKKNDFRSLGRLLFLSHESLKNDYEVSCPELDLLYIVGQEYRGCLGARLVGAGFGGSGIAIIERSRKSVFKRLLTEKAAQKRYPKPRFYEVTIGGGAEVASF